MTEVGLWDFPLPNFLTPLPFLCGTGVGAEEEEAEEEPLDLPSVGVEGRDPDVSEDAETEIFKGFFTFEESCCCDETGDGSFGVVCSTNFLIPVSWSVVMADWARSNFERFAD